MTTPPPLPAFVAICLGYFMTILDTTIVNVALPTLAHGFGAGVAGLQWVVDGYALVFAALLLSGGALGDRLGARAMFQTGLVVFTATSALCGLAPTLWALIAFRIGQGVGAALLVPTSLALLRHAFPDADARARAIGIWGSIAGVAAASGPVAGGLLVTALGWRAVFLVNVPVGLLALMLVWRFVTPVPHQTRRGLDLAAQLAAVVALGLVTFVLIEGGAWGWASTPILGALGGSVLSAALFCAIERRAASLMLPLSMFRASAFSAGTAVGLLLNFGFFGQLFFISLYFQQVRGYSPLLTGLALLPEGGLTTLSSFLSGRLSGRRGPRLSMAIGLLVGSVGLLGLCLVGAATPYVLVAMPLAAAGSGIAFTVPAVTTAVLEAAPHERAGIASGVINASRQLGGVLGVAVLGALVGSRRTFLPGMHLAAALAGSSFLLGLALTCIFVPRRRAAREHGAEEALAHQRGAHARPGHDAACRAHS